MAFVKSDFLLVIMQKDWKQRVTYKKALLILFLINIEKYLTSVYDDCRIFLKKDVL